MAANPHRSAPLAPPTSNHRGDGTGIDQSDRLRFHEFGRFLHHFGEDRGFRGRARKILEDFMAQRRDALVRSGSHRFGQAAERQPVAGAGLRDRERPQGARNVRTQRVEQWRRNEPTVLIVSYNSERRRRLQQAGDSILVGGRFRRQLMRCRGPVGQMVCNGKLSQGPNGLADYISSDHLDHSHGRFNLHVRFPFFAVHAPVKALK